jgi:TonB-dependent receptor
VDLGFEYYFSNASVLSFGLFYKDMESNAYTTRSLIVGGPQNGYTLITPANAESAWVRGFEFGYDQQFTFLPAPFDGLGAFANYTYADSEVDTGIAAFANEDLPLFNQVGNTVNVGLFYEKSGFRARVSVLHRTESLIDIQTDAVSGNYDPKLSRYLAPNTTLDITGSYRFAKNWTVFASMQNALSEPGRAYDGNKNRMDYNEVTKWSANLGLRWSL